MTRVLVVHHDIDLADQEVDSLRRLGYEPVECSGPAGFPCPVLRGEHCPQVHEADVLLSDVWSTTESGGGKALIEGLREMHPEIPIILTAPGMELDWVGARLAEERAQPSPAFSFGSSCVGPGRALWKDPGDRGSVLGGELVGTRSRAGCEYVRVGVAGLDSFEQIDAER